MRPPKLITGGLGNRRSTESRRGRAARMARKLRRQGYSRAAESMALQAAQIGLVEPSTKTQDYRWAESNMQQDVQDAQRRRQAQVNAFLRRNPYYGQQPDADAYDGDVPRTWSGPRRGGTRPPQNDKGGASLIPYVRIANFQRSENNPHLDMRDDPTSKGFVSNEERRQINADKAARKRRMK